ncbi:putative disease resistance protein RGA3 isoform X2 [Aristolochia californica]|uniref:putative disease resistance protein RGA3 isoform X2 n=1 Tax=Aristolochia californica TaxID=171875 RepID=UPI0035DCEFFC
MVVDAALSSIFQGLCDRFTSYLSTKAHEVFTFSREVEIKYLCRRLWNVRALIEEAEKGDVRDEAVRLWLSDLRDVANDIEDLLDQWQYLDVQAANQYRLTSVLGRLKKTFIPNWVSRLDMILKKMDGIEGVEHGLPFSRVLSFLRQPKRKRSTEFLTGSMIDESTISGRRNDRENVIAILVSDVCGRKVVEVLPIVGMGGVGKTTLAQLVYNDNRVLKNFEVKAWVCVSHEFDVRQLTKAVIESITGEAHSLLDIDPMQRRLQELLRGKRFLIVLDDVWNENRDLWNDLKLPFQYGQRGSKILVTTRNRKVCSIMGTVPPYCLECLSDDDSWCLFEKEVFGDVNSSEHPQLRNIGYQIVKKCKGLPLAVKTLAGCLHCESNMYVWNTILQNSMWNLPDEQNDIIGVLKVSFNYLPAHLKQCFEYCSIFPKGYEFDKYELVLMWIASGFVLPIGGTPLETRGTQYFDDLLSRFFLQESPTNKSRYKMHDLIHDLAQYVSQEFCIRLHGDASVDNFSTKARHVSIVCVGIDQDTVTTIHKCKGLRTLLFFARDDIADISSSTWCIQQAISDSLFLQLNFLRVLDLSVTGIIRLPDAVGQLKHLRYLDLSWTHIRSLPGSIGTLHFLETLKLNGCSELLQLPATLGKLKNLRHLPMEGDSFKLVAMPFGMSGLTQLQTLSKFVLRKKTPCGISELMGMRKLQGTLSISKLENVAGVEEASAARMNEKSNLQRLELRWTESDDMLRQGFEEEVLEVLRPNRDLKYLGIFCFKGRTLPTWLRCLSHLESICLFNCRKCKDISSLAWLPCLKKLVVIGLYDLKRVEHKLCQDGTSEELFPSLETLILKDMPILEKWSDTGEGAFPCLLEFEIANCPILLELPNLPSTLKKLQIHSCKMLTASLNFPSLQYLVLDRCNVLLLRSLTCSSTSLSTLAISNFPLLPTIPMDWFHSLTALNKLEIRHMDEFLTLSSEGSLHGLISLQDLVISDCPRLRALPDWGLPIKLLSLEISSCPNLKRLPRGLENISLLESLTVDKCPGLECMAEVELPTMLKELRISACDNLKTLPTKLHNLTGLSELKLWDCPKLESLPERLPMSIEYILVNGCPLLKDRCGKGQGIDWFKIEHIPRICINEEWISLRGDKFDMQVIVHTICR